MLPQSTLSLLKRVIVLSMFISLVTGTVGNSLLPLLPAAGQTSPQNTDIFTAQFIPAYLGAAYDPSVAYKQMAGLPVYVYAYDTADKIVNNYIYLTQVRADGSIQAAGLPNASHYGVCVPVNDEGWVVFDGERSGNTQSSFRPPITGADGDGLESVFAFNMGLYPRTPEDTNPRNQLGEGVELSNVNESIFPDDPDRQGCRTFLTSNRAVDIANHVNIFPLVPTTVLTVMIYDSYSADSGAADFYNKNSPYEIYAQRIAVTTTPATCDTGNDPSCQSGGGGSGIGDGTEGPAGGATAGGAINSSVANGPIIRGRTIALRDIEGGDVGGTIFQAYAPQGLYAITYWRPDSRDAKTTLTYLSYSGSEPLNTPYNGIAFEKVSSPSDEVEIGRGESAEEGGQPEVTRDTNQWKQFLRGTSTSGEASGASNNPYFWKPTIGNLNIWGLTTVAAGTGTQPKGGQFITIGDLRFSFIDPMTRQCANANAGTISEWGIYLFSTSCSGRSSTLGSATTDISIRPGAGYFGVDNQNVTASGTDGPSRHPFPLTLTPTTGVRLQLQQDGRPIPPTLFSMVIDGKFFQDIARSTVGGQLVIPGAYFSGNRGQQYEIFALHAGGVFGMDRQKTMAFTIDGGTLHSPQLALNNLGTVSLDSKQSVLGRWLAKLNLSDLMERLRVQPAFALGDEPEDVDLDNLEIYLNRSVINSINPNPWFTSSEYNLTRVELVYPDDVVNNSPTLNKQNYVIFNRYTDAQITTGQQNGIITADDSPDAPTNNDGERESESDEIVGVRLKYKTEADGAPLETIFKEYQNAAASNTSAAGTMPLELKVIFEKIKTAKPNSLNAEGQTLDQSGQDSSQIAPEKLEAYWPILLKSEDAENDEGWQMYYDPVVLSIKAAGCPEGDGWFGTGFGKGWSLTAVMCKFVSGIVTTTGTMTNFVASNLITLDPLQFEITRAGWNIVRNIINGFAVLLLIVSGIAIMLRYEPQQFNLQNALTKLITTIVLVNFSILIIQFAIDAANVMGMGGYYLISSALATFGGITQTGVNAAAGMAGLAAMVFAIMVAVPGPGLLAFLIGLGVVFAGLVYVLFKAILFWIIRQIVLIVCIIGAPVALAARILPSTQIYYNKWKSLITATLINQILFAFILAIAIAMLRNSVMSNSWMAALAQIGIAIGLFWYSTKFPAKAMSAFEGAAGIAFGALAAKALTGFRGRALNAYQTRASRRFQRQKDEAALGVDKETRRKRLEEYDAANSGLRRDQRFVFKNMYRLGLAAGARRSVNKMRTDVKLERQSRTSPINTPFRGVNAKLGLATTAVTGATAADVDKWEDEASKRAQADYTDYVTTPEMLKTREENAWEEVQYKPVNEAAQAQSLSKLTDQRNNLAALEASANATLNVIDPQTGKEMTSGPGRLGDFTPAPAGGPDASYDKGFNKAWEKAARHNSTAVGRLRTQVSAANIGTRDGFNDFFKKFSYEGNTGNSAWVQFYNDIGQPIPASVNARDLQGKVFEDIAIRPATQSGFAGWGNQLRSMSTQVASSGSSDRSRVSISSAGHILPMYDVPIKPGAVNLGPNVKYVRSVPSSHLIPERMSADVIEAIQTVKDAYNYGNRPGHPTLSTNSTPQLSKYNSALSTLQRAGYTVR